MENIEKILKECRCIVSKKNTIEKITEIENNDNFIKAMIETDHFNIFYDMLGDDYSKAVFKKVVTYRYILAFNKEAHINYLKKMKLSFKYGTINTFYWAIRRLFFLIERYGYPREIENNILFYTFISKQYDIKNIFEVNGESVVFDIGAWKGDTAYFFSKKCSDNSQIYSFEPDINAYNTLNKVKEKYKLNNVIAKNILFSDKEEILDFISMSINTPAVKMKATTVDKFVEDNNIKKLNYIKMDVEGAEIKLLTGSVNTIKKFNPSLAIAIYHGGNLFMEDFYKIPIFIKNISKDYKYYLRVFTPYAWETILFCKPKNNIL